LAISATGLSAFHAVAQAGSFTRAARARNVSQPTLSAQVRNLEEAYGVRLFDRVGRSVKLTPLGQSLFVVTARMFAAEEEAEALLAGVRTLSRGHLRIAADSATHVMPALGRIREKHPGLTFSLTIGNSSDVLERLLDYEADVAVTAKQTSDPRILSVRLRTDRLVGFLRSDHPFAKRTSAPIEAFADQDVVLRERGSVTREVFETKLAEAGVKPGHLLEVQTREAVREAVLTGFGVGVIFESEFRESEDLKRLEITGADLSVAEYAVCLEERRRIPLVRSFMEAAQAG
jgi:aminoethylphosphonate catabolism LysR family transcriptional regulator